MAEERRIMAERKGRQAGRGWRAASKPPQVGPLDQEMILDEAARQFRERGFEATRMQDIAMTFGVTHAALYYYFPKKRDLLIALNTKALDALIKNGVEAGAETDTAADRFVAQLREHIRFVMGSITLAGIFFEHEERMGPTGFKEVRHLRKAYTDLLVQSFADAQEEGSFQDEIDPHMAVNLLLGAANWMYRWLEHPSDDDHDSEAEVERVLHLLADGVWASGRRPRSPKADGQS